MELLAGTALLALGGLIAAQRSRSLAASERALRCLALLGAILVLSPRHAAGVLGAGWLLSLTARQRGNGWDLFAAGCGLLGRGLLAAHARSTADAACCLLFLAGWLAFTLRTTHRTASPARLRCEIVRARQRLTERHCSPAWRLRASDALARAIGLTRVVLPLSDGAGLSLACSGVAALADGDPVAARDSFALARRAVFAAAGTAPRRREELSLWLELIDWCDYAVTLIGEEARP